MRSRFNGVINNVLIFFLRNTESKFEAVPMESVYVSARHGHITQKCNQLVIDYKGEFCVIDY